MEAIRTIAIEAINDIVEKRVDARIASPREHFMDRAGATRVHEQEKDRSPRLTLSPPPT